MKGPLFGVPFTWFLVPLEVSFCSRNASVNRVLTQPDGAYEVSPTPGAPTEQRPFRMPAVSVGPIHAGNGRAFRSLTARGGGFAFDECPDSALAKAANQRRGRPRARPRPRSLRPRTQEPVFSVTVRSPLPEHPMPLPRVGPEPDRRITARSPFLGLVCSCHSSLRISRQSVRLGFPRSAPRSSHPHYLWRHPRLHWGSRPVQVAEKRTRTIPAEYGIALAPVDPPASGRQCRSHYALSRNQVFATAKPQAQTDQEFTWRSVQMSVFLQRKGYDSAMMPGARDRPRNGLPVSCLWRMISR